ncbi:MAG: hypothetical protein Q9174_003308 [Haloplaca sp. 1 TL-2023]
MASQSTGLIRLACPEPDKNKVIVDIVFIHGLGGDSKRTWTVGDCCWPLDLLPKDITKARVFSFGYPANITSFWGPPSKTDIGDHADSLRWALLDERLDCSNRPIIFVAHSLGGLVCAEAILRAKQTADGDMATIADTTHGIAFLGTPHRGSNEAKWAEVGRKIYALMGDTNNTLLKEMSQGSGRLVKIGHDFPFWLRQQSEQARQKVSVVCFFEALDTKAIGGRVVTKEEATLEGGYETIEIEENHEGMCKCKDRNDPVYKVIIGVLRIWVKNLEEIIMRESSQAGQNISNSTWTGGINNGQYIPQLNGAKGMPINFTNNNAAAERHGGRR